MEILFGLAFSSGLFVSFSVLDDSTALVADQKLKKLKPNSSCLQNRMFLLSFFFMVIALSVYDIYIIAGQKRFLAQFGWHSRK